MAVPIAQETADKEVGMGTDVISEMEGLLNWGGWAKEQGCLSHLNPVPQEKCRGRMVEIAMTV